MTTPRMHPAPMPAAARRGSARAAALVLALALARPAAAQEGAPPRADWRQAVDSALGRRGVDQPGGVRRWSMPRSDLHVTVRLGTGAAVVVRPALALGSWLAMLPAAHGGVVAMGDLVLRDVELAPVLARLQAGGVEQSAIHHHLVGETPRVLYVHVHAHGDPLRVAEAVRAAVALTGTPPERPTAIPTGPLGLDTAAVARALGRAGRANGGVYQVSVPRAAPVRDAGEAVPPSMGLATAINFQPTGRGRAAVTGDFVLTAAEVNPVVRALGEHGIVVTSLHNHLLAEEPRLFFMHFWAEADAVRLAAGLRAALERTDVQAAAR